MINLFNDDCLKAMKNMSDNEFDLAIVDPPYGMPAFGTQTGGDTNKTRYKTNEVRAWDIAPSDEYFSELERVSKNRIIWGGNYFNLPPTRGIIAWDKCQFNPYFSGFELAWTSFQRPAKIIKLDNKQLEKGDKIHPTQKPVTLYKWLLKNYAEKGDRILDTHLGSGSIAIACHHMGHELTAYEINEEYYQNAIQRFERHKKQLRLFDAV